MNLKTKLGNLVSIQGGGTPNRKKSAYWNGDIPWASVKDIKDFNLSRTEEFITEDGVQNSSTNIIPKETVVVVTRMAVGRACITDFPIAINQDLKALFCSPKLLPRYLLWFLISASTQLNKRASGATVKGIKIDALKDLDIPLPPLEEQKRIAAILDKADAVRQKRKKAIALTEDLLRSTFLDMFGDPVTNPKGWDTKPLGEFLTTIIDYRGKTPKKSSSGIPLISAANIHYGRVDLSHKQYISEKDYAVWTTRGFTKPGDILITTEAPVGEVAPYPDTGTYQISRRIMALRPDVNLVFSSFLLHTMLSKNWLHRLRRVTRGSTVPRVLKPDILGQLIPCVPLENQEKFNTFIQRHKTLTQSEESIPQELDNLFNSLLQKAFRGEL